MPIPTPEERPDLYDNYDGLPDGQQTTVTTSSRLQQLIEKRKSEPQQEPKHEKSA